MQQPPAIRQQSIAQGVGLVAAADTQIAAAGAQGAGAIWLGTVDEGVFVAADGTRFAPYTTPAGGTLTPAVRAITIDLYGGVWIGGDSGGLARVAP